MSPHSLSHPSRHILCCWSTIPPLALPDETSTHTTWARPVQLVQLNVGHNALVHKLRPVFRTTFIVALGAKNCLCYTMALTSATSSHVKRSIQPQHRKKQGYRLSGSRRQRLTRTHPFPLTTRWVPRIWLRPVCKLVMIEIMCLHISSATR